MVLVLNLNMAIDKTAFVKELKPGQTHRFPYALTLPGGKGVNVARVLKTLGIKFRLMGFISGHNGDWIRENLEKESFEHILIENKNGESRICYSIVDSQGISSDFNEDGPKVDFSVQKKFLEHYSKAILKAKLVSLSGRSVRGLKKGFYRELISKAKSKNIHFFADLSGDPLLEIMRECPTVVKINNYEFESTFSRPFSSSSIDHIFKKYESRGLEMLVVTNGPLPFYCRSKYGMFEICPPRIERMITPVGAGDSFMAALIAVYDKNMSIEEKLSFCAASAAADCRTIGAGIIGKSLIRHYKKLVKVVEVV